MTTFSASKLCLCAVGAAIVVSGCTGGIPGGPASPKPEVAGRVGPSGGTIEVTDPASPLHGARLDIPPGALADETDVSLSVISSSALEEALGEAGAGMRFFGGIRIDAGEAELTGHASIWLPNSLGATPDDQLLVGEIVDLDGDAPGEILYRGLAHVGSPITFPVSNFGSFAVLSPSVPLAVVGGALNDQDGEPVVGGLVATSFSAPFMAQTDSEGHFEIPAGPCGSSSLVLGVLPGGLTDTPFDPASQVGAAQVWIPSDVGPLPGSISELFANIVLGNLTDVEVPEAPPECHCDPAPACVLSSKEDAEPPFELADSGPESLLHTHIWSPEEGWLAPGSGSEGLNPVELLTFLWTGSSCRPIAWRFWTDDENIAFVNPTTGVLEARGRGETWLRGTVTRLCSKNCSGIVLPCISSPLVTPAKVIVSGPSLIVHVHNPEGVEIASIEVADFPMQFSQFLNVTAYRKPPDADFAPVKISRFHEPIELPPGTYTVVADFNGMSQQQDVILDKDETKEIVFTFERTEIESAALLGPYCGHFELPFTVSAGPGKGVEFEQTVGPYVLRGGLEAELDASGAAEGTVEIDLRPDSSGLRFSVRHALTVSARLAVPEDEVRSNGVCFWAYVDDQPAAYTNQPLPETWNWMCLFRQQVYDYSTGFPRFLIDGTNCLLNVPALWIVGDSYPGYVTKVWYCMKPATVSIDNVIPVYSFDCRALAPETTSRIGSKTFTLPFLKISSVPYDVTGTGVK